MEQISNPLNRMVKFIVGATLVVARIRDVRFLRTTGRDKPVPYDSMFLARPRPGPGVETSMEQIRNPLNRMVKSIMGATLAVARAGHAGWPDNGTGQARPLRPRWRIREANSRDDREVGA